MKKRKNIERIIHIPNQIIFSALFDKKDVVIKEKIRTLIIEREKYITFFISKNQEKINNYWFLIDNTKRITLFSKLLYT